MKQPNAKIIFTCWSHSTSRDNKDRSERITGFYDEFYELVKDEDIHIIPPLDVDNELTNGLDDWYHMKPQIYRAIAGYIYTLAAGKIPSHGKMSFNSSNENTII